MPLRHETRTEVRFRLRGLTDAELVELIAGLRAGTIKPERVEGPLLPETEELLLPVERKGWREPAGYPRPRRRR